ncbi:unnamed protein product, partial [Ceratitis capitata]
ATTTTQFRSHSGAHCGVARPIHLPFVSAAVNCDDPVRFAEQLIVEINSQVVLFRDMLIHVGQARDCPELREKIRKLRRTCVEACKHTGQIIMPQVKR